jgi:hypothetical protein
MSWEKNTYKEIKSTKTPIDMIMEKAATMTNADFMQWLTIHAVELKQAEISLLSKAYFDGLSTEPSDREAQTAHYISEEFKYEVR